MQPTYAKPARAILEGARKTVFSLSLDDRLAGSMHGVLEGRKGG